MQRVHELIRPFYLAILAFFAAASVVAQNPASFVQVGDAEFANHQYTDATKAYEQALAAMSPGVDPLAVADTKAKLLRALLRTSQWDRSYTLSHAIVATYDGYAAPDDARIVSACTNAGLSSQRLGHLGEAETLYRRALAIQERKFGNESPEVAGALHNLVQVLHNSGRYEEAEQLYRRLLAIDERRLPANDPRLTDGLDGISCMLNARGKIQDALPYYRRSALINEKKEYSQTHQRVNPQIYTQSYREALQKLGWTPAQISAELESLAIEAQAP